jgi:hypothetical protein
LDLRTRAVPAALGGAPIGAGALRTLVKGRIWLWGDQAAIDLEARNSVLGRNLLGVYDRYGWHHPGPLWLLLLGLFRLAGGGSPYGVVVGSYAVQAAAAVSIVLMAERLRPGLTAWWALLAVAAYTWDLGPERLGTVWAPYAVALPSALLVLLAADLVTNEDAWPAALGMVLCATFLVQTDVSTGVVTLAVVVAAVVLRLARGAASERLPAGRWKARAGVLAGVAVVAWLPPIVQQLTTDPGNLGRLALFFTTHHARRPWGFALRALGTVFSTFPLRRGPHGTSLDAKLTWLASAPLGHRPWYLVYLVGAGVVGAVAVLRRRRAAGYLAALCFVALAAGALSVKIAYGPLYPYLVVWTGALAVPAWVALWLAVAPEGAALAGSAAARQASSQPARPGWLWRLTPSGSQWRLTPSGSQWRLTPSRQPAGPGSLAYFGRLSLPAAALLASAASAVGFVLTASPMEGTASVLGHRSWSAVAAEVAGPAVRTVLVDIDGRDAMPEAVAIADQAVRLGRRVELDRAALYFLDPSFAPTAPAQLKVVVCCGKGDPGRPPPGVAFRARVGGQSIYSS